MRCFNCRWVRVGGGVPERLNKGQLKSLLFPVAVLAQAISMTHSGILYRLDISKFSFYKPMLFQLFCPLEIYKILGFPLSLL